MNILGVIAGVLLAAGGIVRIQSTIDFPNATVGACTDLNVSSSAAATGQSVLVGPPLAAMVAGSVFMATVSATNVITVRHCCSQPPGCNPGPGVFTLWLFAYP